MGKELPMARAEEEGQSVLLAITGSGEIITTASRRNKRSEKTASSKRSNGGEAEDIKAKSQNGRKTKRANASPSKSKRCRRDYSDRKSDRRDEGEDEPAGRTAQELGIVHPGNYCDEAGLVPHHWVEVDNISSGLLLQCKNCLDYLWLPLGWTSAERLGKLMGKYGKTEGYCRFLNYHRTAKVLIAKMQDLRRRLADLEKDLKVDAITKREFAKLTDKILSDRKYDRKEV